MQRWFTRDWGVKLGAILLATGLWFHAVTQRSYRRHLDIPLVIEQPVLRAGEPEIVLSSMTPASVRIAVFGPGKDLLRAAGDDFLLRLQLPPGKPGRKLNLRLDPSQVESHSESELAVDAVVEPTELSVILDHSQQWRVPVRPRIGLQLAESYTQVGPMTFDVDSVDVRGPLSHLRQLDVIFTDSLFRADVRDDIDIQLSFQIPEGRLVKVQPEHMRVRINVQELAEYEVLNVPVNVVGGPPGAIAEPSRVSVRVRGGADLIGNLDPETDIHLTVPYDEARSEEGGPISAPGDRLYEVRQVTPARATVVTR